MSTSQSLIGNARQLRKVSEGVDRARKLAQQAQIIDTRLEEVRKANKQLMTPVAVTHLLIDEGVIPRGYFRGKGDTSQTEKALDQVQAFRASASEDAEALLHGNDYGFLKAQLVNLPGRIETDLRGEWIAYYEKRVPSVPDGLTEVLKVVAPGLMTALQIVRRQIEKYANRFPRSAGELQEFRTAAENLDSVWQKAQASLGDEDGGMPAQVLAFVRGAASPEGVSLANMTPDVIEWLRENDLLSRFRVLARRNAGT